MHDSLRIKYYKTAYNYLSGIFKTPPYIIFFVSDTCPNNCLHCWYKGDWKKKNITNDLLTFDEIEKISKSISYIHFLTLTGGEAFLRNEIVDIVSVFNSNCNLKRCDIPTSGFDCELICDKVLKILKKNIGLPFRIDVSLDGIYEKHDEIRHNPGLFKEVCKTLEELKKIKKQNPNLDISIITTISEHNNVDVQGIADFVQKILPDGEWMVNIQRPLSENPEIAFENFKAYQLADSIISNRIKHNKFKGDTGHSIGKLLTVKNSLRRKIIMDIMSGKRLGGGCSAGSLIGAILNDGGVRPCEMDGIPIGNIRDFDYDFKLLWNSERASTIRNRIQDEKCLCTNECFWSTNILIQPSCWAGMLKKIIYD